MNLRNSGLFRNLDSAEVAEFVQWARDNFTPGMEINELWHPVVQDELARLQAEHDQSN